MNKFITQPWIDFPFNAKQQVSLSPILKTKENKKIYTNYIPYNKAQTCKIFKNVFDIGLDRDYKDLNLLLRSNLTAQNKTKLFLTQSSALIKERLPNQQFYVRYNIERQAQPTKIIKLLRAAKKIKIDSNMFKKLHIFRFYNKKCTNLLGFPIHSFAQKKREINKKQLKNLRFQTKLLKSGRRWSLYSRLFLKY